VIKGGEKAEVNPMVEAASLFQEIGTLQQFLNGVITPYIPSLHDANPP